MKLRILSAAVCFLGCLYAQNPNGVLAPSRAIDWTQIGAGAIPTNRTQCGATIAAFGSSGTRQSPSTITSAMSGCAAGTYVQLGAGTFYLSGQLALTKSNVTLRGMGPDQTVLDFGTNSPTCGEAHPSVICVLGGTNIDGSSPDNVGSLTVAPAAGATSLSLGSQTTGSHKPAVGDVIELNQAVDGTSVSADKFPQIFECLASGSCTVSASGTADDGSAQAGLFQVVQVQSITSGTCTNASPCTVGISPPIHMPNWGADANRAWWSNSPTVVGVGVENLQVNGSCPCVGFVFAAKSWMKNVELWQNSYKGGTPHYVLPNHSTLITIRDSYIVGQFNWSDEYAIDCYACSSTLVENNIIQGARSGFVQEQGEGNIVSYNYHVLGGTTTNPGNEEGVSNNHGCCSSNLLLEGNDAINTINDNYYGSGQFHTFFRNRLWGDSPLDSPGGTGYTTAIVIASLTRFSNIIGNVLGTVGYHTHYAIVAGDGNSFSYGDWAVMGIDKGLGTGTSGSIPDDTHGLATTMRWGNWDVVTNAVRWCGSSSNPGWSTTCANTSEVPTGLTDYPNAVPSSTALPPSFYLPAKPAFWGTQPWPAIGPDVSGGDLANSGGLAYRIPARVCFETVMGGAFSNTVPKTFNANNCYGSSTSTGPTPPTFSSTSFAQ